MLVLQHRPWDWQKYLARVRVSPQLEVDGEVLTAALAPATTCFADGQTSYLGPVSARDLTSARTAPFRTRTLTTGSTLNVQCSTVIATTPGTPEHVILSLAFAENLDNTMPDIYWPCLMDDSGDCWCDCDPPIPGMLHATFMQATKVLGARRSSVTRIYWSSPTRCPRCLHLP